MALIDAMAKEYATCELPGGEIVTDGILLIPYIDGFGDGLSVLEKVLSDKYGNEPFYLYDVASAVREIMSPNSEEKEDEQ